jgi:hypothetical protein
LHTLFSNMADRRVSASRKSTGNLLKRMFLVTLVLLTLGALFLLLLTLNRSIALPLLDWVGVAALGIGAGLAARWQLRGYTLALKFLTAALALAINLWLLGWLSSGLVGFTVRGNVSGEANWRGLAQLAFGSLLAWLSLWAGKAVVKAEKPPLRKTKQRSRPAKKGVKSALQLKKPQPNKSTRISSAKKPRLGHGLAKRFERLQEGSGWPQVQNPFTNVGPTASRLWKNGVRRIQNGVADVKISAEQTRLSLGERFTRQANKPDVRLEDHPLKIRSTTGVEGDPSEIHLLGDVEHRCPFCLEVVEKNDPRGVKICPICHTRHHADCWAVTGTCQVPHYYE